MSAEQNITGIILAGGKSRRMGSDKGLLPYKGKPMISYSIDLLSEFCSTILISTNSTHYDSFGHQTVSDIYQDAGPLGGLYSCLLKSKSHLNLCLPCDTPQLSSNIIQRLIDESDGNYCIIPYTSAPEPLISIYPSSIITILEEMLNEGEFRMTEIFRRFPTKFIQFTDDPLFPVGDFRNVNTPKDLQT